MCSQENLPPFPSLELKDRIEWWTWEEHTPRGGACMDYEYIGVLDEIVYPRLV